MLTRPNAESGFNNAKAVGGNVVHILDHQKPSEFDEPQHRVVANIMYMENLDMLFEASERMAMKQIDTALLKDGSAVIHFYRKGGVGFIAGYNVYVDNNVVTRIRINSRESVSIKANGFTTFWSNREIPSEVHAIIRPGRHYYVRCRIVSGVMVGYPILEFVAPEIGKKEYGEE